MSEEVTMMSVKGQIVIPLEIRKRLRLKPRDRLIVYGEEDTIIMKRLDLPELKETWERIKGIMKERNRKYGKLSEKGVASEIKVYRNSN
ncbi:MAG: AbrB/MazE/SpoVT family DNA-binding domain-containing protein [Candidatus Micrarchaeales archaeon]